MNKFYIEILSGKKLLSAIANKSNFEVAKTILHECIHAYLNIKKVNCSQGSSIPEINDLLFPELMSSFYQDGFSIDTNGANQSEHAFIFDYMIPAFQTIFTEIRNVLSTPNDIFQAEGQFTFNNNQSFDWNWQNFFKYFSMQGLDNNNAFNQAILQNPTENFYYDFYRLKGNQFSKTCQ